MAKRFFTWLGKVIVAGLLALALLCGFCFFYYNVPVHYPNPSGATEYVWEANRFYSSGKEGFALGRTNNDGFNNLRDYTPDEAIDILLMGSSHMEAFNVAQDKSTAAVLNRLFAGEKYVYNIGTAGHTLAYCVKHLPAALDTYRPGQYVLLETMTLDLPPEDMTGAVDGTLADIPSQAGGIVDLLQKVPALRLFYSKYVKGNLSFGDIEQEAASTASASPDAYEDALSAFIGQIADESAAHGLQAVIIYNPGVQIAGDGSFLTDTDPAQLAAFQTLCTENGVRFLDLTEIYLRSCREQHLLPAGFSNTAPGKGHLNAVGHRLIAETVYAAITAWEG